jgi:hypothetical protein
MGAGRDDRRAVRFPVRDIAHGTIREKSVEVGLRHGQEFRHVVRHDFRLLCDCLKSQELECRAKNNARDHQRA